MLAGVLGSLLPTTWHAVLLERLFKGDYEPAYGHFQLAVAPALACYGCTAVVAFVALAAQGKPPKPPSSNTGTSNRALALAAMTSGLLDAFALLCLNQAFLSGTFVNVWLTAAVGSAVSQLVLRILKERSLRPFVSIGNLLIIAGTVVYAFFRWSPPFGSYGATPYNLSTCFWATLHVALSTASLCLKVRQGSEPAEQRQLLAWTSGASTLVCCTAALITFLFTLDENQSHLLHNKAVQLDLAVLGLAYALASLFYTYIPFHAHYPATQLLRFVCIAANASVIGYVRIIGALGWLGISWIASGVALECLAAQDGSDNNATGFVQLPLSALGASTASEKHANNMSQPASPNDVEDIDDDLYEDQPSAKSKVSKLAAAALAFLAPLLLSGCVGFSNRFLNPLDTHSNLLQPGMDQEVVTVEGTGWAVTAHNALKPVCPTEVTAQRYERTHLHTALATWPRSGNSWTRMLIERSSGYRTSTLYCDGTVEDVFLDDCYHEGKFLEKTHYPYLRGEGGWDRYEKAVRPIRNPLDASYSFWHFWRSIDEGERNHTSRVALDHPLGQDPKEREELLSFAKSWVQHDEYWSAAPIPTFVIRYEDLRRATLPNLMAMLSFFIPDQDLPSLEQVTCALELNESLQPYKSAKHNFFYSWDKLDPSAREEILQISKVPFCKHNFDKLFKEVIDDPLPIDCNQVRAEVGPQEPPMP